MTSDVEGKCLVPDFYGQSVLLLLLTEGQLLETPGWEYPSGFPMSYKGDRFLDNILTQRATAEVSGNTCCSQKPTDLPSRRHQEGLLKTFLAVFVLVSISLHVVHKTPSILFLPTVHWCRLIFCWSKGLVNAEEFSSIRYIFFLLPGLEAIVAEVSPFTLWHSCLYFRRREDFALSKIL